MDYGSSCGVKPHLQQPEDNEGLVPQEEDPLPLEGELQSVNDSQGVSLRDQATRVVVCRAQDRSLLHLCEQRNTLITLNLEFSASQPASQPATRSADTEALAQLHLPAAPCHQGNAVHSAKVTAHTCLSRSLPCLLSFQNAADSSSALLSSTALPEASTGPRSLPASASPAALACCSAPASSSPTDGPVAGRVAGGTALSRPCCLAQMVFSLLLANLHWPAMAVVNSCVNICVYL